MATFDWFTKYGITCDWGCHRGRGSLGGEDRAHPLGEPVLAPYDGVVTYGYYNDGASYAQIKYSNGYAHQAIHVQKGSRVGHGSRVSEGTRVAISGGARGMDGAGTSSGPHVHLQGMDPQGRRIRWQDVPRPYEAAQANVSAGQRTAGDNGAKRRSQPTSKSAEAGDLLAPGVVGNFDGWIRGENVEGNDVWFRGISGNWFWSGGFREGANTSGLKDLNPTALAPTQRRFVVELNARADARTDAPSSRSLPAGTIGNFDGWKRGSSVEGEDRWLHGAISGEWFWLGGLEPRTVEGLADMNPVAPPPATNQRTVIAASAANGRGGPSRAYAVLQSLDAGDTGTFDAWTHGEMVEGIDVWFRGALQGRWFWAGGFTSQATDGLTEVSMPTAPDPKPGSVSDENPLGLPTHTPFYPGAFIGLDAPLGNGPRGSKGTPPNVVTVEKVIDQFHIHRTGSDGDDLRWFSTTNDRSSCPHLHILQDGRTREFIRPGMKPALTGPEWNWRGYGIEIQGAGDGTAEQFERVADIMAWLASHEGRELDGTPVRYNLRQRANTTLNHREMVPGTECPGDWWHARMDALIVRAREILATKYAPAQPQPDMTQIPTSLAKQLWEWLKGVFGK